MSRLYRGGKECAVMACAKQKGRRFCGECGEFPCEILMEYEKQPGKAGCVENCRRIKAEWVKAALRLLEQCR